MCHCRVVGDCDRLSFLYSSTHAITNANNALFCHPLGRGDPKRKVMRLVPLDPRVHEDDAQEPCHRKYELLQSCPQCYAYALQACLPAGRRGVG
jgi:hypothetical protein